jgi:hypothetical protein
MGGRGGSVSLGLLEENERKGGGCPGLALQERGLSLVAGCRKGNGAAVMRWFRRRLQRWSWRKTVSVSCGRGRKKKKKNLQKLGEDAGFFADFGPQFLPPQVFNRDSIYRRCKRAILSILGKIFSP